MWDLARLRIFGVLQRIAVCFLLASLLVLYVPESRMPVVEVQLSQPLHVLKCLSFSVSLRQRYSCEHRSKCACRLKV